MAKQPVFNQATFVKSVVELSQLPADKGAEVAFIGRSNAGKSSALNTITNIKGLARVSKTPGRTQAINVFALSGCQRLMDLPGYGYAKVPIFTKKKWQENINCYLEQRKCLRGLVLLMDIRHPLKPTDRELLMWTVECQVPVHVLLTKADKLKSGAKRKVLKDVQAELAPFSNTISVQLFSSQDRTGVDEACELLTEWLSTDCDE